MGPKTKNSKGLETKKQADRTFRRQQIRLLVDAAKDYYGMLRSDPDLHIYQKLYCLDEGLKHILDTVLNVGTGILADELQYDTSVEQVEEYGTPRRPTSQLEAQQTPPKTTPHAAVVAQASRPHFGSYDSDEEDLEHGWTPRQHTARLPRLANKIQAAFEAVARTPERAPPMLTTVRTDPRSQNNDGLVGVRTWKRSFHDVVALSKGPEDVQGQPQTSGSTAREAQGVQGQTAPRRQNVQEQQAPVSDARLAPEILNGGVGLTFSAAIPPAAMGTERRTANQDAEAVVAEIITKVNSAVLGRRKLTTTSKIADGLDGAARADDVLHVVKERMSDHVKWHTAMGPFGTILWPKTQDAVELLHKDWHFHDREIHRLMKELHGLREQLDASKAPDMATLAVELNKLVREEVKRLRGPAYNGGEGQPGFDISKLDVHEEMQKFDPKLLDVLERLTWNEAANGRGGSGAVPSVGSCSGQSKLLLQGSDSHEGKLFKLRTFFALCVLIYATNPQAKHPFQLALTDVVESMSSSPSLIAVLNHLGVTTSKSTLDRYIYELSHVVVSVDNVDKVAGGVKHDGKEAVDFHGVTVQLHCKASIRRRAAAARIPPPSTEPQSNIGRQNRRSRSLTERVGRGAPPATGSAATGESGNGEEGAEGSEAAAQAEPSGGVKSAVLDGAGTHYHGPFADLHGNKTASETLNLTADEAASSSSFDKRLFRNVLRRERTTEKGVKRPSLRDEMASATDQPTLPEQSKIVYVATYDLKVSNKEELTECLCRVKSAMEIGIRQPYLLVVGDQQAWALMVDIKNDMPGDFAWLYPFPGDWHTLMNAQPIFKRIFFDAGLDKLAGKMGYAEGAVQTSLKDGRNFRRNNLFLIECWEAMYRKMIQLFLEGKGYAPDGAGATVEATFRGLKQDWEPEERTPRHELMPQSPSAGGSAEGLGRFGGGIPVLGRGAAGRKQNLGFWWRFVMVDMKAYISLWLAIRTEDWDLRVAAYKLLGPLFRAYDRTHYQRLIPLHLAHLQQLPPEISGALKQGLWTVSLKGRPYKSLALDEAHETLINRDLKMSMNRPPTAASLSTNYLNFRSVTLKIFKVQVSCGRRNTVRLPRAPDLGAHQNSETNIQGAVELLGSSSLSPVPSDAHPGDKLWHLFSGKEARRQSEDDLLGFRTVGTNLLFDFVKHTILQELPTSRLPPAKKQHLLGFKSVRPTQVKKGNPRSAQAAQQKQASLVYKRAYDASRKNVPFDPSLTQTVPEAQALFDANGRMRKGQKSKFLRHLVEKLFPSCLRNRLPEDSEAWVVEGMFMLGTVPIAECATLHDYYVCLLVRRWIITKLNGKNEREVHVSFDDRGHQTGNKNSIHAARAEQAAPSPVTASLPKPESITQNTKIPTKGIEWRACEAALNRIDSG
ncbi:hypothetical protein KFL_013010010, partial [Klebsormidium nitens]